MKRISVRFNLDSDDDRRAWEALHRLDSRSVNKEIIARINAKEQTDMLRELIRQVISEELARAARTDSIQLVSQKNDDIGEMDGIFDFLDSF